MTDFDRLVLDIETDASVTPAEAISSSGGTLRNLFEMFADLDDYDALELDEIIQPEAAGQEHLDLPIEALDLSERPRNCLRRAQVQTVGELIEKSEEDLLNITNFGQKSLEEVVAKLDELGFSLQSLADADHTERVV
jgi:DNA-directed RNA polymerase subunit alpha